MNTGAFRFFAHGPHKNGTGRLSLGSTTLFGRGDGTRNIGIVLTRTPCALGYYSTGPRIERFTVRAFTSSLGEVRTAPKVLCGFRPNSRIKRNRRSNIHFVTRALGAILHNSVAAAILLRAVTNGNARVNGDFRRLRDVVRHIRLSSGVNIYLSAYRIFSTNCSVIGSLSNILRRFSGVVKVGHLHTLRLGSDGGPFTSRGSHRRGVNLNDVNRGTFRGVMGGGCLHSLPVFLRAPGRLSNCGTRVTLLHSLREWTSYIQHYHALFLWVLFNNVHLHLFFVLLNSTLLI